MYERLPVCQQTECRVSTARIYLEKRMTIFDYFAFTQLRITSFYNFSSTNEILIYGIKFFITIYEKKSDNSPIMHKLLSLIANFPRNNFLGQYGANN